MMTMLLTLLSLIFFVPSCRTNTAFDMLFYDTNFFSNPNTSPTVGKMCTALEQRGYHFYDFAAWDRYTEITYPDNTTSRYFSQTTIHATLFTDIERDFETNTISNTELDSKTQIATELCIQIAQKAEELQLSSYDIALRLYDPINGVTVNYNTAGFDGNCDQLTIGSVALGGYGQSTDLTMSICGR
jgi:hypothetical protein